MYSHKEECPISVDLQRVAGNYGVLTFSLGHQVAKLQNQKCGTHIEELTAMKFRNWGKLSYRANQLERAYLEKNWNWVKVRKSNYSGIFFFFLSLKKNFFVFENFKNLIADSKLQ